MSNQNDPAPVTTGRGHDQNPMEVPMHNTLTEQQIDGLLTETGLDKQPSMIVAVFKRIMRDHPADEVMTALTNVLENVKYVTPADLKKELGGGDDVESAWARVQPLLNNRRMLSNTDENHPLDGHAVRICRWELERASADKAYFIFKNAYAAAQESARSRRRRDKEQAELGTARKELRA